MCRERPDSFWCSFRLRAGRSNGSYCHMNYQQPRRLSGEYETRYLGASE
nr:MAG TPA: hypothetical protein [Caudoviricetes sp.]